MTGARLLILGFMKVESSFSYIVDKNVVLST